MKSWKIDRRTMLKGAGGVALALPFLDVMADSKKGTPPKRLACVFFPNGVITNQSVSESLLLKFFLLGGDAGLFRAIAGGCTAWLT